MAPRAAADDDGDDKRLACNTHNNMALFAGRHFTVVWTGWTDNVFEQTAAAWRRLGWRVGQVYPTGQGRFTLCHWCFVTGQRPIAAHILSLIPVHLVCCRLLILPHHFPALGHSNVLPGHLLTTWHVIHCRHSTWFWDCFSFARAATTILLDQHVLSSSLSLLLPIYASLLLACSAVLSSLCPCRCCLAMHVTFLLHLPLVFSPCNVTSLPNLSTI